MDHRQHRVIVAWKPVAQPRHQFRCVRTKTFPPKMFAQAYLPDDHPIHDYKAAVMRAWRKSDAVMMEGAIRADLVFTFATKRKKDWGLFKITKPDLDNLEKAVLDALTDAGAFRDDAQVVMVAKAKFWGEFDSTSIALSPLHFDAFHALEAK